MSICAYMYINFILTVSFSPLGKSCRKGYIFFVFTMTVKMFKFSQLVNFQFVFISYCSYVYIITFHVEHWLLVGCL